jgi:hypothetical protein
MVEWSSIEKRLIAASADVKDGISSRVRCVKDGTVEIFHRRHPAKEAKCYHIRAARAFLEK